MAKRSKKPAPKAIVEKTMVALKNAQDNKLAKAVKEIPAEVRVGKKFQAWTALFMDKSNKNYWGNATKCAMQVYDTKKYQTAGAIGSQNLKKLKELGAMILEGEGMGFGEMMKIGAGKMLKGSYSDWDAFMERLGYFKLKSKTGAEVENTFNFDFNNLHMAIERDRKARGLPD